MAKAKHKPSIDQLQEIFEYQDGNLLWKKKLNPHIVIGSVAGSVARNGYIVIGFNKMKMMAHRIVYMLHHNELPDSIDHIDGNRKNNKIENLRKCNYSQNLKNQKLLSKNTSGAKNVSECKRTGKWVVRLSVDKKQVTIGRFEEFELAELVAIEARNKFYKEFARHY